LQEIVQSNWTSTSAASTPTELNTKFESLAICINRWEKKVGHIKSQLNTCSEFLLWIDQRQEIRQITLERKIRQIVRERFKTLSIL
jgi:hypothetical protein